MAVVGSNVDAGDGASSDGYSQEAWEEYAGEQVQVRTTALRGGFGLLSCRERGFESTRRGLRA